MHLNQQKINYLRNCLNEDTTPNSEIVHFFRKSELSQDNLICVF